MIKKLSSIGAALLICCMLITPAFAREGRGGNDASWILYDAGILRGTGKTYADGSPNLEYNSKATRSQAAIMFVRLLGKEEEALQNNLPHPFTDVSEGASPYIGYLYQNGLTNGFTATTYGSQEYVTAAQYTTFTLRALGYHDPEDFTVATAETFGDSIGLHSSSATDKNGAFRRGAMAAISCYALSATLKDTGTTLADHIGLDFLTYPKFKALVSVGSPKKFNEGRDINYEYKVKVNMPLDEFDATGVEILTWNIKMLMSEYNTKTERTYYIFDLYVGNTEVGYAYGYPNGGCICNIY